VTNVKTQKSTKNADSPNNKIPPMHKCIMDIKKYGQTGEDKITKLKNLRRKGHHTNAQKKTNKLAGICRDSGVTRNYPRERVYLFAYH